MSGSETGQHDDPRAEVDSYLGRCPAEPVLTTSENTSTTLATTTMSFEASESLDNYAFESETGYPRLGLNVASDAYLRPLRIKSPGSSPTIS